MDARVTKKRIGQLLSYDWLKIVALIVAAIVVWSIVFSMTATRLNQAQTFTVYVYKGIVPERQFYTKTVSKDEYASGFSYDVIETNIVDLASAGDEAYTLLTAHLGVNEGNVLFVSPQETGSVYTDENGEERKLTYVQDAVSRTYTGVLSLGSHEGNTKGLYFDKTEAYLSNYFADITDETTFDAAAAERDFRARIAAQKDKRYKNETQILQGVADEIKRIKGYRENYFAVKGYLESGVIALQETTVYMNDGKNLLPVTGYFSINLCPDERMASLKDVIAYVDGDGKTTAKDMQLILLDQLKDEYEYGLYENYAFIRAIVESCVA